MLKENNPIIENSESDLIWVDNAKIIAIFAVVALHIAAAVVSDITNLGRPEWWIGNVYDSLTRWCVPVFIMISGALLLDTRKNESIPVFYRKRASGILLPTIFWSVFFLGWTFLKGLIKGKPYSFIFIVKQLFAGRPYFHMWFLYMLIGLYLFTPFLRTAIKNMAKREQIVFVAMLFTVSIVNKVLNLFYPCSSKLFINWFLFYLPYFISGHLIREMRKNPNRILLILFFTLSMILTSLGLFFLSRAGGLGNGLYFYDYLSITVVPMSLCMLLLLKTITKPIVINSSFTHKLAQLVLGVYLVHPVFIDIFKYFGVSGQAFNPLIAIPLISFLVFVFSLIIAKLISMLPYLNRII